MELAKVHGTDLREYSLYKLGKGSYADLMSYAWTSSKSSNASQKTTPSSSGGSDPAAMGRAIGEGLAEGLIGKDDMPHEDVTAPKTRQTPPVGDIDYWSNAAKIE